MTTLEQIGLDVDAIYADIRDGYISVRTHPRESDLCIYNYTAKTQYERAWTKERLACRGLIVWHDGTPPLIGARPFPKFFNLGELDSVPESPFVAQEKMDGSLGIIYMAPGGVPAVATRGSFNSEQAIWATEYLQSKIALYESAREFLRNGLTLLVEIIYPENRIVIDYGDLRDLVALTAIDNATGLDVPIDSWPGRKAETYSDFTLDLFMEQDGEGPHAGGFNREGVVLRWDDGTRAKVKFEEYVRLHRIITRVTERSIWEMLSEGKPIESLAEYVPDEFYDWMKKVATKLFEEFTAIEKQCLLTLDEVDRSLSRREQAEFILQQSYSGIVFLMLDGKPYREKIWPLIRPDAVSPFAESGDNEP